MFLNYLSNYFNAQNVSYNFNIIFVIKYILPLIWFSYLIISCIINIVSIEKWYKKVSKDICQNRRLLTIFENCKKKLNIKNKHIDIICADWVTEPSTIGIRNVKILLMKDIIELTDKEIEFVILHELIHYKRKDNLLKIIIKVLENIYFFNLFIIFLFNKIKAEMEKAVDEQVTDSLSEKDKNNYCLLLIKLSTNDKQIELPLYNYFGSNSKTIIKARIRQIKNDSNHYKKLSQIIISIIILIIAILSCFVRKKLSLYETKKLLIKSKSSNDIKISGKYEDTEVKDYYYSDFNFNKSKDNVYETIFDLLRKVDGQNLFYKFLKFEKIDNKICEVFSIYTKTKYNFISIDVWVDLETGNILKEKNYWNLDSSIKPENPITESKYTY